MAEVIERVVKLEERFDGVTRSLAEVKAEIRELRSEMQSGFSALRGEFKSEVGALRGEMHTQFRWLMSGLGGVVLAVLVAMLTR